MKKIWLILLTITISAFIDPARNLGDNSLSELTKHDNCRTIGQSCICKNTQWNGTCGVGLHYGFASLYCQC